LAHVVEHKKKLLNRVSRLRGQVDALERALEADEGCGEVLRLLAAARGAINGIMAEVVTGHVLMHTSSERKAGRTDRESLAELMDMLKTYIR
jgi:DNA-binding FrmR family transcriptional regulator